MRKNFLLIRACGLDSEKAECDNIKNQAELFNICVNDITPSDTQALYCELEAGLKYDYIYLSAHGNQFGFANESRTIDGKWKDFAEILCNSSCLNEDSIIMLSCCRGGLNQIAYEFFYQCDNISYIIGPRQSLTSRDMLIGFSLFIYNVELRNLDPIVACEKIKCGTDIRFFCFDRLETETDFGYVLKLKNHEFEWNEMMKKNNVN